LKKFHLNVIFLCYRCGVLFLVLLYTLPTVRSSNSGKTGMVHPKGSKVAVNWPIVTNGSTLTTFKKMYSTQLQQMFFGKIWMYLNYKIWWVVVTRLSTSTDNTSTKLTVIFSSELLYFGLRKEIVCQPGLAVHISIFLPLAFHSWT